MKDDVMPSVVQMEYGQLQDLLKEVKETIAKDIKLPEPKTRNLLALQTCGKSARMQSLPAQCLEDNKNLLSLFRSNDDVATVK
jgi:hypothetical protein